MKYLLKKDKIIITGKQDFAPRHILECGQVFCYRKIEEGYEVFPGSEYAKIIETESGYEIITNNPNYFVTYFDLDNDYSKIKAKLKKFELLSKPIDFGYGIRILKQDLFETLISFIISANNNIKRIQLILGRLRNELADGKFPSYECLKQQSEQFFVNIGAGYRAKYLYKVLRQITPQMLEEWRSLDTLALRDKLISLSGVGPKVADCILLFGYGKQDVFPVDTWIHQMYNKNYPPLESRVQIRKNLVEEFGSLAGYAQQYLFYYQRSFVE